MNKSELISEISKKTQLPKRRVTVILDSMFDEIKNNVCNGENIYLRELGSFITKTVTRSGEQKCIPSFKPGKKFVDRIKESNYFQ